MQRRVGSCSTGETLLPLQTFGPYELDELLGRGRTGEVHRAWDTSRHRTVALRILSPALSADAGVRARFLGDCRRAAQVDEPHLVAVHGSGEIDGRLYADTQLVDGRALSAVVASEGPLPAGRAVDVVGQVAAALDAAHATGLVHGDVTPSDVLLSGHSTRPDCHLTGFGLAGAGGGVGYVAPEHLTGRPVDHRVDVHALACLLYELLTGRPPLPGDPPRPSAVVGSVPEALDDVVTRGMAADPDQRHRSAGELARAARAALVRAPDTVPLRSVPPAPTPAGAGGSRAVVPAAGPGVAPAPSPPASHAGRHRPSAPGTRSGRRRRLVAALVAGGLALATAGGVAATQLASDASDAPVATPVTLEPVDAPGEDPFVPMPGQTPPGTAGADRAPTSGTDDTGPEPTTPDGDTPDGDTPDGDTPDGDTPDGDTPDGDTPDGDTPDGDTPDGGTPVGAAGSPVAGDRPGLYGGSGEEVCDVAAMTAFLTGHPDRAAAFAAAQDVPTDGIGDHLASLTPVVLRFDTAVTNHGFADGRATPFQSVLQAGTAVLVDDSGVPRVRCTCGNPLDPPASRPSPAYRGNPWPGFGRDTVVVVEGSPAPVSALVVVDQVTGVVEARPVGTTGDADRAVGPVLAEQARALGTEQGTATSGSGTPSATPSVTAPDGSGPSVPDPPPADRSAGTGQPPADGASPSGGADGEPGTTTAPDPGSRTSGSPDADPPSPDVPGEPDEPPADSGTTGDPPARDAPAEEAPPQEAPAPEAPAPGTPDPETPDPEAPAPPAPAPQAPAPEVPAPEVPARDAPAEAPPEEAPTDEASPEETPTDEAPTEETPTEEAPAEEAPAEETAVP